MKLTHSERRVASLLLGWIEPHVKEAALLIDLPISRGVEPALDPRAVPRKDPPDCGGSMASPLGGPTGLLSAAATTSTVDELRRLPEMMKAPCPVRRAQFGRRWAWRAFSGRPCSMCAPSPLSYL
jgi:hypothetical protein